MSQRLKYLFRASGVVLFSATVLFLYVFEHGNFHTVTAGGAYRSGQLDSSRLAYYIKKYNIKSILNLRGNVASDGENVAQWYLDEKRVAAAYNVTHYDVYLSASHELENAEVEKLMEVFKSAPRPILIHCKSGADRSGLVAAMWKVIVDKEPKSEAGKQLSVLYGHFPIGNSAAMDRFFRNWQPPVD